MKAKYLGLDLSSPIVVSSSPYTATVSNIEQCVRNGAGAVVLKSIFEEQIYRQAASLDRMEGYGDAGEYLERYLGEAYKAELLELVSDAAKTGIPVIGSINCAGAGDAWIEYAAAAPSWTPVETAMSSCGSAWAHNAVLRRTLRSSPGSLNGSPFTRHIFSMSMSGSKKRL